MYMEGKKGVEVRYIPANARPFNPCGRKLFAGALNHVLKKIAIALLR